jgi:hypothetical protein
MILIETKIVLYLFGEIKMETTILIKLLNDMYCSIYIIRYNNNLPSLNYCSIVLFCFYSIFH